MKKQLAILTVLVGLLYGCGTQTQGTAKPKNPAPTASQTAKEVGTDFINDLGKKDYNAAHSLLSPEAQKSVKPADLSRIIRDYDSMTVEKVIKDQKQGNFEMVAFITKQGSSKAKGYYYDAYWYPFTNVSGHWYIMSDNELQPSQHSMAQQFANQITQQLQDQNTHDEFIRTMQENDRIFQENNRLFMEQMQRDMETAQQAQDQANQDAQQAQQQAQQAAPPADPTMPN